MNVKSPRVTKSCLTSFFVNTLYDNPHIFGKSREFAKFLCIEQSSRVNKCWPNIPTQFESMCVRRVVARLVIDSIWVVCWKPAILIVFWNIWITREARKVAVMKCKHYRQGLLDLHLESEHNEAPAVAVSGDRRSTSAASDLSRREKSNVMPPFSGFLWLYRASNPTWNQFFFESS